MKDMLVLPVEIGRLGSCNLSLYDIPQIGAGIHRDHDQVGAAAMLRLSRRAAGRDGRGQFEMTIEGG